MVDMCCPTIVAAINWPEAIRNRQKPTKKKLFRSRHSGGTHDFRTGRQRKLTVPEHDVLLQLVVALLSYCNHWWADQILACSQLLESMVGSIPISRKRPWGYYWYINIYYWYLLSIVLSKNGFPIGWRVMAAMSTWGHPSAIPIRIPSSESGFWASLAVSHSACNRRKARWLERTSCAHLWHGYVMVQPRSHRFPHLAISHI